MFVFGFFSPSPTVCLGVSAPVFSVCADEGFSLLFPTFNRAEINAFNADFSTCGALITTAFEPFP